MAMSDREINKRADLVAKAWSAMQITPDTSHADAHNRLTFLVNNKKITRKDMDDYQAAVTLLSPVLTPDEVKVFEAAKLKFKPGARTATGPTTGGPATPPPPPPPSGNGPAAQNGPQQAPSGNGPTPPPPPSGNGLAAQNGGPQQPGGQGPQQQQQKSDFFKAWSETDAGHKVAAGAATAAGAAILTTVGVLAGFGWSPIVIAGSLMGGVARSWHDAHLAIKNAQLTGKPVEHKPIASGFWGALEGAAVTSAAIFGINHPFINNSSLLTGAVTGGLALAGTQSLKHPKGATSRATLKSLGVTRTVWGLIPFKRLIVVGTIAASLGMYAMHQMGAFKADDARHTAFGVIDTKNANLYDSLSNKPVSPYKQYHDGIDTVRQTWEERAPSSILDSDYILLKDAYPQHPLNIYKDADGPKKDNEILGQAFLVSNDGTPSDVKYDGKHDGNLSGGMPFMQVQTTDGKTGYIFADDVQEAHDRQARVAEIYNRMHRQYPNALDEGYDVGKSAGKIGEATANGNLFLYRTPDSGPINTMEVYNNEHMLILAPPEGKKLDSRFVWVKISRYGATDPTTKASGVLTGFAEVDNLKGIVYDAGKEPAKEAPPSRPGTKPQITPGSKQRENTPH